MLLVLGAAIAMMDGLTRAPNTDWEMMASEPLQYEPYVGAFVFAGVALMLMFGAAYRLGTSYREALLLWFVFCTASYTKDFAYLRLPGTPLFVTDVVLLLLVLSVWRRFWLEPRYLKLCLICFWIVGAIACARGFLSGHEPAIVVRDFALVIYSFYFLVGLYLFDSWISIQRLLFWFVAGAAMSCINGLAWFVVAPDQRRLILYGVYISLALVGILAALMSRSIPGAIGVGVLALLTIGLTLANARSLFAATGMAVGLILLTGTYFRRKLLLRRVLKTAGILIILAAAMVWLLLQTSSGKQFVDRAAEELISGLVYTSEDANMQFRMLAWAEAVARFLQDPWLGEGFGVAFTFSLADTDPRPHNTFLTVLYKMGIAGAMPLLGLLGYVFLRGIRGVRAHAENRHTALLYALIIAQLVFCTYGIFNLLLESPFLASLFWISMGLGLRMVRILDAQQGQVRVSDDG